MRLLHEARGLGDVTGNEVYGLANFEATHLVDHPDRVFHVEVLRGGMNRLLLRSNKSDTWSTRIEIIFMNVKYVASATLLHGLVVRRMGTLDTFNDSANWNLSPSDNLAVYSLRTSAGEGIVVAGSMAVDESDASPSEPSRFFMMD